MLDSGELQADMVVAKNATTIQLEVRELKSNPKLFFVSIVLHIPSQFNQNYFTKLVNYLKCRKSLP